MKKLACMAAVAVVFALAVVSCGGGGNLKGTVWIGKAEVGEKWGMYDLSQPVLILYKAEFDAKEPKVTIQTGKDAYLIENAEYSVDKKDLIIYEGDKKKALEYKKNQPDYYNAVIIKGSFEKDTLKIGKAEFTKKSQAEADKIIKGVMDEYEAKLTEYKNAMAARNDRYK